MRCSAGADGDGDGGVPVDLAVGICAGLLVTGALQAVMQVMDKIKMN